MIKKRLAILITNPRDLSIPTKYIAGRLIRVVNSGYAKIYNSPGLYGFTFVNNKMTPRVEGDWCCLRKDFKYLDELTVGEQMIYLIKQ